MRPAARRDDGDDDEEEGEDDEEDGDDDDDEEDDEEEDGPVRSSYYSFLLPTASGKLGGRAYVWNARVDEYEINEWTCRETPPGS